MYGATTTISTVNPSSNHHVYKSLKTYFPGICALLSLVILLICYPQSYIIWTSVFVSIGLWTICTCLNASPMPLIDILLSSTPNQHLPLSTSDIISNTTLEQRIETAAVIVNNVIIGKDNDDDDDWNTSGDYYTLNDFKKRRQPGIVPVKTVAIIVFAILPFIEFPGWCYDGKTTLKFSCGDPSVVLRSSIPILSKTATCAIELICLSIFFLQLFLRLKTVGYVAFKNKRWNVIQFSILLADTLAVIWTVTMASSSHYIISGIMLLNPLLRPLYIISTSARIRRALRMLLQIIPRVKDGLSLLVILISFYATIGLLLFNTSLEGKTFFPSFAGACLNLLILLTTANFPDVMMPAYSRNRSYALFFVSFLIVGLFFLLNLIFATIYEAYKSRVYEKAEKMSKSRMVSLTRAFDLLSDSGGGMKLSVCNDLYQEVLKGQESNSSSSPSSSIKQRNGVVDFDKFLEMVEILRKTFTRKEQREQEGGRYRSKNFIIIGVIVLNAVAIIMEIEAHKNHSGGSTEFYIETIVMPVFTLLYWVELYTNSNNKSVMIRFWMVFNFVVTIMEVLNVIVVTLPWRYGISVLLVLRVLRCMRVVFLLPGLHTIFIIFLRLLPAFKALYGMLIMVMYIFANVGMELFGGTVYVGNPNLVNSTFASSNYYSNNFNDFGSSMMTLFELLIVNNWHVIMDGIVLASGSHQWHRLYFVAFYFIAVVMVLNLVVAFIVDAFFEQKEQIQNTNDVTPTTQAPPTSTPSSSSPKAYLLRRPSVISKKRKLATRKSIATRVSVEDLM